MNSFSKILVTYHFKFLNFGRIIHSGRCATLVNAESLGTERSGGRERTKSDAASAAAAAAVTVTFPCSDSCESDGLRVKITHSMRSCLFLREKAMLILNQNGIIYRISVLKLLSATCRQIPRLDNFACCATRSVQPRPKGLVCPLGNAFFLIRQAHLPPSIPRVTSCVCGYVGTGCCSLMSHHATQVP